jgi:hypothetical protein
MHINVKWGIYAAIAALLLAFLTSILLGHASFGASILRGLAFAVLFFVLGTGAWTLINTFIPEVLFPDEGNDAAANLFGPGSTGLQGSDSQLYGSRINITLADKADAALPENNGSDIDDVGNISDLVSGTVDPAGEAKKQRGLDEFAENSYTNTGEDSAPPVDGLTGTEPLASAEGSGGFTMNFDSFTMGGGTSGMDPFGDSFSLPADGGAARKEEVLPERKSIGNTPKSLEGDFNPKDIALGIRTVMENDKKG